MSGPARRLALLGRRGALPAPAARLVHRVTGFGQVLTRRATIERLVSHPGVTVPYGPRSDLLGLGSFPLALDGARHGTARAAVARALAASAGSRAVALSRAAELAATKVDEADGRIDVVADLVDPVLRRWVETWFGLPHLGAELQRTGRLIMHAIFLNPPVPAEPVDGPAVEVARQAIEETRLAVAARLRGPGPAPAGGSLAALLAAEATVDAPASVLGLTVGPLALGSWSLANAIDELLDHPGTLDQARTPVGGRRLFDEGLGRRPPLPGVPRHGPAGTRVELDRNRGITLPGGPVLAATEAAATLDPRGDRAGLAFGLGPHACLGREEITEVAGVILAELGRRRPRRQSGDAGAIARDAGPSGVSSWPFPGHLVVRLAS